MVTGWSGRRFQLIQTSDWINRDITETAKRFDQDLDLYEKHSEFVLTQILAAMEQHTIGGCFFLVDV